MKHTTFKQFLAEGEKDFRKIIKVKRKKKTVAVEHPISVGGGSTYYGMPDGGGEAGGSV